MAKGTYSLTWSSIQDASQVLPKEAWNGKEMPEVNKGLQPASNLGLSQNFRSPYFTNIFFVTLSLLF
jgi:hypothetical protein